MDRSCLASAALVAALASVGCGGDDAGPANGAQTTSSGSGGAAATTTGAGGADPGETYSATFGPVKVASGAENTQCVVQRLGNDHPIHVSRIHNVLSEGSHHFIVYKTSDTAEQLEPFDCDPFVDTLDPAKGAPLMITQKADEVLELPAGVGFTLEAHQMVRLEMHFIDATANDLDVQATSTFTAMPEADFHDEADFLFIGNPDISLPPNQTTTLGPTYFRLPSKLAASKFFALTGHTHQLGENVTVGVAPSKGGEVTSVYDVPGWKWSEPATVMHDPPFEVPADGGFSFTCTWNNTSSKTVGFGESATKEMCFFWAYYYPSAGALVCAHTDQVAGGYDLCCPGNPACGQLF